MDEIRVGGRSYGYVDAHGQVFLIGQHCGAVSDDGQALDGRGRVAGFVTQDGAVADARGRKAGNVQGGEVYDARGRHAGTVFGPRPLLAGAALLLLQPQRIEEEYEPKETNWVLFAVVVGALCLVGIYLIAAAILYGPMVIAGCIAVAIWGSRAFSEAQGQGLDPASAAQYVQDRRVRLLGTLVAAILGLSLFAISVFSSPTDKSGVALMVPAVILGIGFTWFLSGKIVARQLARYAQAQPRMGVLNWKLATQISGSLSGIAAVAAFGGVALMKPAPTPSSGTYVASSSGSGSTTSTSTSIYEPVPPPTPSIQAGEGDGGEPEVETEVPPPSDTETRTVEMNSCVIDVPAGWSVERRDEGARSLAICRGPDGMEARLDVTKGYGRGNPATTPRDLEAAFKKSSSRRYDGLGIQPVRVGEREAARWDFRLARKENGVWTPTLRKAAIYVSDGKLVAALVSCPDEVWKANQEQMERILTSFRIVESAAPEPESAEPYASGRTLSEGDLEGKTAWELAILRNEPYARHGLRFRRKEFDDYFRDQSWYRPSTDDQVAVHDQLTDVEKRNVATILAYQKRKKMMF